MTTPPCQRLGRQCAALDVTLRVAALEGNEDHDATWLFGHVERISFGATDPASGSLASAASAAALRAAATKQSAWSSATASPVARAIPTFIASQSDTRGDSATIYREWDTPDRYGMSPLLYLRQDLLTTYLRDTSQILVWVPWGERTLHYDVFKNHDLPAPVQAEFQARSNSYRRVIRCDV